MAIPTEIIDPNALRPHPENYNLHPEGQINELEASYDKFNQFKNIVVWSPSELIALEDGRELHPEEKYILAGHGFWQAALRAGATAIEVKDYSGIPYEDALLLMQVDNAAPLGAQPDADRLAALMEKTRRMTADRPQLGEMLRKLGERMGVVSAAEGGWGNAFGSLPDEDRSPYRQMTFTLHDAQAEQVESALKIAKQTGETNNPHNENSNGNALAFICEIFLESYGQS